MCNLITTFRDGGCQFGRLPQPPPSLSSPSTTTTTTTKLNTQDPNHCGHCHHWAHCSPFCVCASLSVVQEFPKCTPESVLDDASPCHHTFSFRWVAQCNGTGTTTTITIIIRQFIINHSSKCVTQNFLWNTKLTL